MEDFKLTHRLLLPVRILPAEHTLAAVRFPRPHAHPLLPARVTAALRSSKFSLKSEEQYEEEERRVIEYRYAEAHIGTTT